MKRIIVNVEGLSSEEKNRTIEALMKIKSIKKCYPDTMDMVGALYGPSFDGINVGFDYHKEPNPPPTPQQVLEMAGRAEKRKVRKDFDPSKEYRVDVSVCSKEEKKEVQQAFFDSGFVWESGGSNEYQHLHAMMYTNTAVGVATNYCLFGTTTNGCNMTSKEFLDLVYEPEQQGHIHSENMTQCEEDAKTHDEPWRLWQFKNSDGVWCDCKSGPSWNPSVEYRRKPKTHIVNGVEIPDLRIKEAPKLETLVVVVDPLDESLHAIRMWKDEYKEKYDRLIKLGLLYEITKEGQQAAILHAKAWLGIT